MQTTYRNTDMITQKNEHEFGNGNQTQTVRIIGNKVRKRVKI